jgi:CubicO group peptidase (beta-lactamase class C family)
MKRGLLYRLGYAVLLAVIAAAPALVAADEPQATIASKQIAAALQPFVDNHNLAGAVALVADRDKVLSVTPVGWADIAAKMLMQANTVFWIASQSKPITAAALMILVDEGKIGLDDPIEKYLPEFRDLKVAVKGTKTFEKPNTKVTVRHVLSHTSGMPFSTKKEQPTLDLLPLRDAVRSYAETPLLFQPGTKYKYSNAGINTAGRLIEVLSGMPYEEFLDKRLFAPLGMKDTTFWLNEEQLKRLAKAYRPAERKQGLEAININQLKYPLNDRKRQPMPAGGLFSTANDVSHFYQMLLNKGTYKGKRILSEAAVRAMTTKQTGEGLPGYGLGLSTGGDTFGHGGALSTNTTVDPKRGLIFVWLVQHAGFPGNGGQAQGVFRKTAEMLYGAAGQ